MKHAYTSWLLIALALLATACGADRNIKRGEKHWALGEYFDAAAQFKQAYTKTPVKQKKERAQLALKMARCYEKINMAERSVAAYRNADRYTPITVQERLNYARQLLKTEKYKLAETQFCTVLDSLPNNPLAQAGLTTARNAAQQKKEGSRYSVRRFDAFNSRRADYSPMFLGNDRLYFTSTRNEAQGDELSAITGVKPGDIFYAEKDDKDKWSKPEPVTGGLNSDFDEGACAFSPDGKTMYLTQCVTDPVAPRFSQVMTSNRSDAAWTKPTPLTITRDTLSSFAHPAISPDGQWLYFTSDMPGGQGGLDIWRVKLTSAGPAELENLGKPVNTQGNEEFPAFRSNGDFYFASDGHPGLGGLDIFYLRPDSSGRPTLHHPSYPLNSSADDFGITFEEPYNKGFFSSNRGDTRGYDHIYSFENPEIVQTIKGWVYEIDGYELPGAQVYIVGTDGTNLKVSVLPDGSFKQVVNPHTNYVLMATCKGHLNHQEQIDIAPTSSSHEHVLQFPLAPINVPVLIENIFYDTDKATLRPESETALDQLVKLLNQNPNITIELSAHTDYRGSAAYNKNLSQRRAESVTRYLTAHGIAPDRLTPVGYGKERPKTIRKKLTETYPFLKEGDVLTEDFIKKLPPRQQDICNQLNRRTEFTVLRTTYGMFDEKGRLKHSVTPSKQETTDDEEDFIMN